MRRLKIFLLFALCILTMQTARGFSLLGPFEAFMTPALGYDPLNDSVDLGGPMNLGEEYRWNLPTITYAFDESFLNYFGSNGVVAIDQAMAILNGVPPVSTLSSNLLEYPLDSLRVNLRAQALSLLDLKSATLSVMLEQLGLADAERWVFSLRFRFTETRGNVLFTNYSVIQRNFDPVTEKPTAYVNGTLYTYTIRVFRAPPADFEDAVERPVDRNAFSFTSVSAGTPIVGSFYTDLTRDDVGGLRYLYHPKNVNVEDLLPNTQIGETNLVGSILQTIDLGTFLSQARTNPPNVLLTLYPDLAITSTNSVPVAIQQTNFISFFTNYPWQPVGSPPVQVTVPVLTNVIVTNFQYTFVNLVTNRFSPTGTVTTRLINVVPDPFAPVGTTNSFITNITVSTAIGSFPNGDIYILPTNVVQYVFITNQNQPFFTTDIRQAVPLLTNVVTITNTVLIGANGSRREIITFQSNFVYAVLVGLPVNFIPATANNSRGRRPGVDKLNFSKLNYDSLLGQTFVTETNSYTDTTFSNTVPIVRQVRRLLTQPEIIFLAEDLAVFINTGLPIRLARTAITNRWVDNDAINGVANLAGPGVIAPQVQVIYNKIGPISLNETPTFLDQLTATRSFRWGSFDGTTNPPVVYPEGTSIIDLENSILRAPTP